MIRLSTFSWQGHPTVRLNLERDCGVGICFAAWGSDEAEHVSPFQKDGGYAKMGLCFGNKRTPPLQSHNFIPE
jgi:hypothetical protein